MTAEASASRNGVVERILNAAARRTSRVRITLQRHLRTMLFLLFVLLAGALYLVVTRYNALQVSAQGVREAHANVMASMKKRIDLTNKLIDIARGYADHEKLTHISVANAGEQDGIGGAGAAAAGALTQVLKLATQYPDLKANAAYQQLMTQLDQIEGDLQVKRETYNAQVKSYNSVLVRLPVSLFARQLGFRPAPYFDVENADSLDRLKDFHSDDSEHLKEMLAQGSRRLADGGRRIAGESVRIGKIAVEKGMEKGMELHQRHVASAADGVVPAAAADADPLQATAPAPPPAEQPAFDADPPRS
jgi:LemA protein